MKTDVISLDEVLAVIGLKIQEADLNLVKFPNDLYHLGARDQAVNIMTAIREMAVVKSGS